MLRRSSLVARQHGGRLRSFRCTMACAAAAALVIILPAGAWNANADRLIANQAVNTLPDDIRPFFEANRQYLVQHVTDARDELARDALQSPYHYIDLDRYGPFPFNSLPRDYKAAASKFGRTSIAMHGQIPWQIGLYSARLSDAFRVKNWDAARTAAAFLAYYVAEAHDPFNTTRGHDAHTPPQLRVDHRFDSSLFDRYSLILFHHPTAARSTFPIPRTTLLKCV